MGVGSRVKLPTVHPLLKEGVGKATAQLMGAGTEIIVKVPTVHPLLLEGA